MAHTFAAVAPSRLRSAAFTPIGDEGRTAQVEARLVQAISTRAFVEGERLPSENELSQLFGVAVVTVREALGALRHRGYIETRRGRNGGSFVRPSLDAMHAVHTRALCEMPRVALSDLGVHYEAISAACAEYACLRATPEELAVVHRILADTREISSDLWRRRVTDVQLELAALSQSVRLTNEHVRVQTEFTPLLSLQDLDFEARRVTHDALLEQINATIDSDVAAAKQAIRVSVRASVRWLAAHRASELKATPIRPVHDTLETRGSGAQASVPH